MRFLSLCSGIEAASVAWAPLGWKAAAVAEIEAFPSAVLAHHYPEVPNLGDITKFKEWPDLGTIDLICGGTPCQSFSIAGLRKGLADPRGNLSLTFLAIVDRYRPRYVIWENVPGVLSDDGGRSFASIVGGLGQLGYGWAYRVLDAQYVRVDGLGRAVPQRRRRVVVVGYLGDWRRAAAVLSEPESVLGNTPPRRQAGERVAPSLAPGAGGGSGHQHRQKGNEDALVAVGYGGGNCSGPIDVAASLAAHGVRMDFEVETFVANPLRAQAQHSHRLDSDNDIVAPLVSACEVADTLSVGANQTTGFRGDVIASRVAHEVAETLTSNGDAHSGFREAAGLVAHSLRPEGFDASEDGTGRGTPLVPVAYSIMPQNSGKDYKAREVDVAQPLMAGGPVGGNQGGDNLLQPVRTGFQGDALVTPEMARPSLSAQSSNNGGGAGAVLVQPVFSVTQDSSPVSGEKFSPSLKVGTGLDIGQPPCVAYDMRGREDGAQLEGPHDTAAIRAASGGSSRSYVVAPMWAVRRLMPIECERLQGFSDGYTDIIFRGKPAADGPRYKALGNSWAVNVFRWVGRRIEMVEQIAADIERERAA